MFKNKNAGITPEGITVKPKKKYTVALYSCIIILCVCLSMMCTTLYTHYLNHKADMKRVEAIAILDNEYCGESLLGEVMPHDQTAKFTGMLLEQYLSGLSYDDLTTDNVLYPANTELSYESLNNYADTMREKYQYIGGAMKISTRRLDDGPVGLTAYSMGDDLADYNAACRRVYEILSELNINGSVTKKEAIIRINEWICNNRYYETNPYNREWSTLHSIKGESAVCYNYTVLFQMLCLGCGIECEYVLSDNGTHCWNKVYSNDGSYWFVDVCWNDGAITGVDGTTAGETRALAFNWFGSGRYDYLLETSEEFYISHKEYFIDQ